MTWPWAKPDSKETRAAMDALDGMVNAGQKPKGRDPSVMLYCCHPDGQYQGVVWDPATKGRGICTKCGAVYIVTCEKNPAPGK